MNIQGSVSFMHFSSRICNLHLSFYMFCVLLQSASKNKRTPFYFAALSAASRYSIRANGQACCRYLIEIGVDTNLQDAVSLHYVLCFLLFYILITYAL